MSSEVLEGKYEKKEISEQNIKEQLTDLQSRIGPDQQLLALGEKVNNALSLQGKEQKDALALVQDEIYMLQGGIYKDIKKVNINNHNLKYNIGDIKPGKIPELAVSGKKSNADKVGNMVSNISGGSSIFDYFIKKDNASNV